MNGQSELRIHALFQLQRFLLGKSSARGVTQATHHAPDVRVDRERFGIACVHRDAFRDFNSDAVEPHQVFLEEFGIFTAGLRETGPTEVAKDGSRGISYLLRFERREAGRFEDRR